MHTTSARWRASHRGKPLESAERMPLRLSVIMRNISRILPGQGRRPAQFYAKAVLASGIGARSGVPATFMESLIMRSRTVWFLCSTLLAVAPAAAQERMYKCVDAKGKVYYTQVPPVECLGRDTQELNKSGTPMQKSQTPTALTPQQQKAREAELKKKLEEEERGKEERRKNTALLNTYSSEKDIDDARGRALKEAQAAIVETEKRIAEAQKRKKELESEKEFYVKKPVPLKLKQDITNNEIEIRNQTELLDAKKKEISVINAKYDTDKRRYLELTSQGKR